MRDLERVVYDRQTESLRAVAPDDRLLALYRALLDADDQSDAQALASLGWQLFALASAAQQANREAAGLLDELCAGARAAVAGSGSPASLALLSHVLAKHGWLPKPGATPLQVLAAPLHAGSPPPSAPARLPELAGRTPPAFRPAQHLHM